ncbi:MAG: DNA recombination protein RmuC [Phycisphaerales bacterium JB059]
MDVAQIVLGVLCAGFAAGMIWALVSRAKLLADMARRDGVGGALEGELAETRESLVRERAINDELRTEGIRLNRQIAEAEQKLVSLSERLEERSVLEAKFSDAFKALSAEALKSSRAEFLEQAKPVFEAAKKEHSELVKPIGETLAETKAKLEQIEKSRVESFTKLMTHVESVTGASAALRDETAKLTRALSKPEIRGQYGEIQLKRVAELAGMTSYCDFTEQASQRDGKGALLRPDMIVKLPNERVIAVDAKTNTYAYLEAVNETDDKKREEHLDRFARHVAEQAKKLSDKKYWSAWEGSPEFTVMFVPGDHFIDAALQRKPELLETAAQRGVILASPSTLIGLLRAVAVGWHEHKLGEETKELIRLGVELHERAGTAFEYASKLGDSIRMSVDRYNSLVGSIDSRLVPTLRKFEETGAKSGKTLSELKPLDGVTRTLGAGEQPAGGKQPALAEKSAEPKPGAQTPSAAGANGAKGKGPVSTGAKTPNAPGKK